MGYIKTKTNLGTRGTGSYQKEALESQVSCAMAPNQDNPFCLYFGGVREPGYKLQPRIVGQHRQAAPNPKFQSVNEANLYQRDVQLLERVQHTTTHKNSKNIRVYECRGCLGKMKKLLHQRWDKEAKPNSKLFSSEVDGVICLPCS